MNKTKEISLILGIDTSTYIGSVGLWDKGSLIGESSYRIKKSHSNTLLNKIKDVLESAGVLLQDIDLIAYAKGPGSFTGLRIGLSTVKGLALGIGCSIVGVSSLSVLAMNVGVGDYLICPVLDARKKEVYLGVYKPSFSGLESVISDLVGSPQSLFLKVKEVIGKERLVFLGEGARIYKDIADNIFEEGYILASKELDAPRGINVARLGYALAQKGKIEDLDSSSPLYLRLSEAELSKKHHSILKSN
jgi:tRNA threonylcarbamoyladenosine biosynthesis protein TsaB